MLKPDFLDTHRSAHLSGASADTVHAWLDSDVLTEARAYYTSQGQTGQNRSASYSMPGAVRQPLAIAKLPCVDRQHGRGPSARLLPEASAQCVAHRAGGARREEREAGGVGCVIRQTICRQTG
jgi:hypothetical protein